MTNKMRRRASSVSGCALSACIVRLAHTEFSEGCVVHEVAEAVWGCAADPVETHRLSPFSPFTAVCCLLPAAALVSPTARQSVVPCHPADSRHACGTLTIGDESVHACTYIHRRSRKNSAEFHLRLRRTSTGIFTVWSSSLALALQQWHPSNFDRSPRIPKYRRNVR